MTLGKYNVVKQSPIKFQIKLNCRIKSMAYSSQVIYIDQRDFLKLWQLAIHWGNVDNT